MKTKEQVSIPEMPVAVPDAEGNVIEPSDEDKLAAQKNID